MLSRIVIERYPALAQRQYLKYFLGSLAAVGATQLVTFGQLWLIYELTASAVMLGLLGAAAAVPNLLMTLFGGVIADRYDKKWILFTTSAGNLTMAGLQVALVLINAIEVWHILAIAAFSSLLNGVDWPTRVAIFPQLVEPEEYLSAVALNSFIWQVMRMAIPALAGFLIFYTDVDAVFGVATCGYLVMCLTMMGLKMRPVASASIDIAATTQIAEGITFILKHDVFKYLLALTFVGMFFCNSHTQLMPMYADLNLRDEVGLGWLLTAGGVGSIVGTVLIGGHRRDNDLTRIMLISGTLTGIATVCFALATTMVWFYVALSLQFFAAFFSAIFLITSMTTMQLSVPDQLRGRVMGIHTMCYSLLPLGGLFLGSLTEWTSALLAVSIGSGIYVAALLSILIGKSSLRRLRFANLRPIAVIDEIGNRQSDDTSASISHDIPVPPKPQ